MFAHCAQVLLVPLPILSFERAATWNEEPMEYRQINRAIDMADGEYGGKSKLPLFGMSTLLKAVTQRVTAC